MNTVQEQITALRNWRESDCMGAQCIDEREDAADTLESMQARIEGLETALTDIIGATSNIDGSFSVWKIATEALKEQA